MMRIALSILAVPLSLILAACANNDDLQPTTRPTFMQVPAEHATVDYWFSQPAVASVGSTDFDRLWKACQDTLIFDQFEINRHDVRVGLLSSWPMISKQIFEPWRSDAGTLYEVAEDSLQTIRRTVEFDFERAPDGTYIAHPRVVIEQFSHPERRITVQAQFTQAFAATYELPNRTTEEGESVANRYWYALGRDEAMEKQLANAVRNRLGRKFAVRISDAE
jgi:hypothetical protein